MSSKSGGWPVISIAGIAAAVVYLIFAFVAFLKYPGAYGPLTNWLSDLGNPLANPSGALFYRLGCILSGAALVLFYLKLGIWNTGSKKTRVLLTIAQYTGVFSAVCLIVTGIFPLGTSTEIHSLWSMMLYISLGFFLTFSATALMKNPAFKKGFGYYSFVTAAVNFMFGAILHEIFWAEWISVGLFIAYVLMITYNSVALARYS
ncbi:MAG: DUF998 domain-containing protein [Dehalococcoidia bacterium]|nr:DUF998 domain-containing protein [Dehalococcoidia bacterium]MDH4299313.1 DUF998 domain-containing protein [Dehalococcoidia bacterium]MDH4367057.1 DUF998 domain-containing protein [Dehalococcoidia bacterium]